MGKKKEAEEADNESLVSIDDLMDNLNDTIHALCERWRMAVSATERDVEDFDIMRLRTELGLFRTPEGLDLFPKARKLLAGMGYTFSNAFGSEIMFLVRRDHDIVIPVDSYIEEID